MTYKFTNSAEKAIEIANDLALELGHNYVGTEHILYGLVKKKVHQVIPQLALHQEQKE